MRKEDFVRVEDGLEECLNEEKRVVSWDVTSGGGEILRTRHIYWAACVDARQVDISVRVCVACVCVRVCVNYRECVNEA